MKARNLLMLSLCFFMLFSAFALPVRAAEETEIQSTVDGILTFELEKNGAGSVQEWLDGALTENAGSNGEWYPMLFSRLGGDYDYSGYARALRDAVGDNTEGSMASREKFVLSLIACGYEAEFVGSTAAEMTPDMGIMDLIYGLHLLNNGISGSMTVGELTESLKALRLEDGGWALTGTASDPDVTAMAVQALAPQYGTDAELTAMIDGAIERLSELQLDTGCYASRGIENPESASMVLIALSAVGIDAQEDSRFVKDGNTVVDGIMQFRLEDGSFSHTLGADSNEMATREVYQALEAYLLRGSGSIFVFRLAENLQAIPGAPENEASGQAAPEQETEIAAEAEAAAGGPDFRLILTIAAAAFTTLALLLLVLRHKKNWKSYAFVLVLGAAVIGGVQLLRVETAAQYYSGASAKGETISTTISIRCDTVAGEADYIPADGVILDTVEIRVGKGETAYDQLVYAAKNYDILLDIEGGSYIRTINNLSELEYGSLSGWMYMVNGSFADVNCNEYVLQEGDRVEWVYTCEIGKDIAAGGEAAE